MGGNDWRYKKSEENIGGKVFPGRLQITIKIQGWDIRSQVVKNVRPNMRSYAVLWAQIYTVSIETRFRENNVTC